MTRTMLKKKLALLIIFVLLFGNLPISSAEDVSLENQNVDEATGEILSESSEEPEPIIEESPPEELPPVEEEVASPEEPPVDILPVEEKVPEESVETPLPVDEEPVEELSPVEQDEDEEVLPAEEEADTPEEIDEPQEDVTEETEPETTEPEKDEEDEDEEEVSDDAYGVDGPINNPGTGQVYYTGEIGASSPVLNWFRKNMLLAEDPVIGVDHPTNPGEIMLFKEAKPIAGKVNTWEVTVRVEAKEVQKSNDIVLVLDTSGSMEGSKLTNTKAAAKQFIDQLLTPAHPQTRIKLITFAGDIDDRHNNLSDFVNYTGASALKNTIDGLYADGGTFTQGALRYARRALGTSSADLKQIVLLSDGEPTYGYSINNPSRYLSLQYIGSASSFDNWRNHSPGGNRKATTKDVPEGSFTNTRTGTGSRMFHRYYNPSGTANDEYYNFGNSAIAEAGFAKATGYKIHTIAMGAGSLGTPVLQGIASPGNAYATNDPPQLASIFATIASKILSAMTNAAANDPMGTGFEVVGNVGGISASTGPDSYQLDGQTISWTIGSPSKPLESDSSIKYEWLKYQVEINDDILLLDAPVDGLYFTNGDTRISFTDIDGKPKYLPFPKPKVDPVLWIAEKVLTDAQGNVITPTDPTTAIFPLQVTGEDYNRTIQMNPGDGGLRKLLTDLRAQQTYTVAETANGYSYGDVAFDESEKKIEIRLGNGSFTETNQFIIAADANGIPNQDVYIRVTNTLPETSVKAKKVWDDNNSSNRPEIYFQLYRQIEGGELEIVPATATAPNPVLVPASLEVAWNNLAQYDQDGKEYSFVVREVNSEGVNSVPDGYVKTEVYDEENDIWVITNRYVPVTITKTVSKIWDDNDNEADYRPDSIKVVLYANDTPVREAILSESNNWTHTWIDLPQGPVYTVREEPVPPRYSVEYEYIPMTLGDSYKIEERGNKKVFTFDELGYPSYYVAKKGNDFLVWTMGQLNDQQKEEFINQFRAMEVNGFNGIGLSNTTFKDGLEFSHDGVNISVPLQKFWFTYSSSWSMFVFGQYHDKVEVTNKYDPASVTATKVWDDQNNKYKLRPTSIKLQLQQNNVNFGDEVTVTSDAEGNWSYTWTDLPKVDASGVAYVYKVVETKVPYYNNPSYSPDGLTVTNSLDVTDVTAKKVWDDLDNEYGLRPVSITLQLRQNNTNFGDTVTVKPDPTGDWSYTWEGLPRVDADGAAYIYTVVETRVPGYQDPQYETDTEGNLIVTNILDFINVTVIKVWEDQDDVHKLRPESITVQLRQNNTNFGDPVTVKLDAAGNWYHTWEDLPKVDAAGKPYEYSVVETAVPGYKAPVYSRDNDGNLVVTNTIDLKSLTVRKAWEDQNDKYGLRPDEVYLQLYRNGVKYHAQVTVTKDSDGNWSHTWDNLPVADAYGNPYSYSVVEIPVPHYMNPVSSEDGLTITNRLAVTNVTMNKVWDDEDNEYGLRPESIILQLKQNDVNFGDQVTLTPADGGDWSYTWIGLPKIDADGDDYVYTVEETRLNGYLPPDYDTDEDGNLIVTNKLERTDVTAQKVWQDQNNKYGLRPKTITLQLQQNGENFGNPVTVKPDDEGNWSYTWKDLPKTDASGKAYVYKVVEDQVTGYEEPEYSSDGLKVTNRLITNDVTANKVWEDQNNKYGLRPESITLQLQQNEENFGDPVTVKPDEEGNWHYTWENLPKVDAEGNKYVYSVIETKLPHYKQPSYSEDGLTVTNSLDVTDVTATKFWDDQEDKYGLRPESITLQLQQNGENFGDPVTVKPDEEGNWSYTWEKLPKVDAEGNEYAYSVIETKLPHYKQPSYSEDGLRVTNSLDVTDVMATKIWQDQDNKFGLRPKSITLQLQQNGENFRDPVTVEPDEDGNWHHTWTGLPRVDADGKAYNYIVIETKVPHYQGPVYSVDEDGKLIITNSLDVTDVTAKKDWDDQDNKFGLRPQSIILKLLQNGIAFGDPVTVTPDEDGNWQYTWKDLPRVDAAGEAYIYTVVENPVPHYQDPTYSEDGLTVTNHLDVTDVMASKFWEDQEDKYGLRPESITLQLMQNGKNFGDPVTVMPDEDGNWHYTWKDLPRVDAEGEEYIYTVVENPVPHYQDPTYSEDGLTVTNHLDVTDVSVIKLWDEEYDWRPASITLQLMQNGIDFLDPVTVMPDEEGNWHYTWADLPRVDAAGEAYLYAIREFNSAPFVPIIEGSAENGFTITNHKPTFMVEKSASTDRYHNEGDIITYQVVITNTGKVAIEGLIIEDSLVPFEEMTLEESLTADGVLEVDEVWTLTYTYTITKEDVENGHVLNVVSVTDPLDPENPQEDEEEIFKPSYTVDKMAEEEIFTNIGDVLHYTVMVVNTGKVAIEDLVIEDSLVPFEDMTLEESMSEDGILEVGETWTLVYQYAVTEDDVERGYVLNLVSVTDPQDPDNPQEDEEDVPLDPKPGMTVEKTAKESTFSKVGEIIHYTVIVKNTGNVSIKDLMIKDTLVPFEDMTLVESKIQDGHLQIGETWTLSYEYKVTQKDLDNGSVLNLVAAIDPKNPDEPVEDEVEVPGEKKPSMEIKKTAKEDKFTKVGEVINYTVIVKNTGNVTLTNLVIEDTLVAFKDMKLVESMTADGHLEVGETWTLAYTYKVTQADVDKGHVLNKVTAKSPEYPDDPVEDEVKVPYEKPKKLPSTGMGKSTPLLVTGIGLLIVTAYLGFKRRRQDK